MWAMMDHNVQLLEDFKHSNLDDPGSPLPAGAVAHPAVMVRRLYGLHHCGVPCTVLTGLIVVCEQYEAF